MDSDVEGLRLDGFCGSRFQGVGFQAGGLLRGKPSHDFS